MALLLGAQQQAYIRSRARALGLDPNAILAVGSAEGGFSGTIGDQGTSFGPFQLHVGGELPAGLSGQAAQAFANSPAGIDYALGKIAGVAKGLIGLDAVQAIVTKFEKPADGGAGDFSRALGYLASGVGFTGVSTIGVKQGVLDRIAAAVKELGGSSVEVTSGKRDPGPSNDVRNSNHITGDAIDGFVILNGRRTPLGTALKATAASFQLRSGDVAGFDPATPGGFDPVHVDDAANVGGVTLPSSGSKPGGGGTTPVDFRFPFAPDGIPLPSIPLPSLPSPGDVLGGIGDVAGVFKKVFTDPEATLGHALLFTVLVLLGIAFVFVGILRATGRSAPSTPIVALAARGAMAAA
jgi:hypothetical protein